MNLAVPAPFDEIVPLEIREEDIIERFVRSKGPGGQNVNKTSTCVHLRHIPTGIEVRCQQMRSQALNRVIARRLLRGKIEEFFEGKKKEERQRVERIKRRRRGRPLTLKRRILEAKRRHSQKKSLRAPVREIEQ